MRFACLTLALVFAACSSSTDSGPAVSYSNVAVADSSYTPDTITIAAGAGVRWMNSGPSTHTVTADTGNTFNSTLGPPGMDPYGYPTAGQSYRKEFVTAGTYAYHCAFHANMHGVVVVTP